MTEDMFRAVLSTAKAKSDSDDWATMPEGRLLTLYAAHDGVPLSVAKVESVQLANGIVRARTSKGDQFLLALEDLFAAAMDAGTEAASARKAGFLGG